MKLSRNQKLVIGAATLWTTCYPFIFLLVWLAMFATIFFTAAARRESPLALWSVLVCFMPFHLMTLALAMALTLFYWAHIIKNNAMSDALRIIFGVAIFWFGYLAMPIYFPVAVWRDETPQWARPSAPLAPSADAAS